VPNASTAAVLSVDPATFSVISQIGVSGPPSAATTPADGSRVFVAGSASNSVTGVETATNQMGRVYSSGEFSQSVSGDNPLLVMATPDGKRLYLGGSYIQGAVAEIDLATGKTSGVPCARGACMPSYMAALPDSSRVYFSGFSPYGENSIHLFWVMDTATRRILSWEKKEGGPMAMSPSGTFLYVASRSALQIFNTAQNAFTGSLAIGGVSAIAFSPDGSTAYAAVGSTLDVIDTASGQITSNFPLGGPSNSVSVSPDGSQVWAALLGSSSVVVIATATGTSQTVSFSGQVAGVAFGVN